MKTLRQSIFLPVFALIVFLGFGVGTALANSSNEGVGGWSSEAVGPGQASIGVASNLSGIDGTGDARFTSQATGSEPKRRAFVGTLTTHGRVISATDGTTGAAATTVYYMVDYITVAPETSGAEGSVDIGLPEAVGVADGGVVDSPLIRTPGGPRAGTFEDDARVVVLGQQTEGGSWEALWILVKPVKPGVPLQGVVVAVDGDEITVESPDGNTETVTLPEDAGDVAPGEVVTVFRGNSDHAKGMVRAEEVKNRLKNFLDDAELDVDELGEDEEGNKQDKAAAHAERIANYLERFNERQTRLLDRAIGRASASVKANLERVQERIQLQRAEHLETIGRIRAKLERAHPDNSEQGRPATAEDHRPDNSNRGRPESTDELRPEKADKSRDGERPSSDDSRGRGRG
jgi:hypothetical protein